MSKYVVPINDYNVVSDELLKDYTDEYQNEEIELILETVVIDHITNKSKEIANEYKDLSEGGFLIELYKTFLSQFYYKVVEILSNTEDLEKQKTLLQLYISRLTRLDFLDIKEYKNVKTILKITLNFFIFN